MNEKEYRKLKRLLEYFTFKINVLEHLVNKTLGDRELLENLKLAREYILKIMEGSYVKN